MHTTVRVLVALTVVAAALPALGAGVVSYQGRMDVGGSAYTGTAWAKLAIVDAAGAASYWSNDGTSVGGNAPLAAVQVAVAGGLFEVLLGDTTIPGMTQPLAGEALAGGDRYLRVWLSTDGSTFTMMTPDRRLASAPAALDADLLDGQHAAAFAASAHAHDAEYVNEGQANSVTSGMLVNGTVTAADLADGATLGEIADDDGAGSGLDADLLDGQQASAFAATAHSHQTLTAGTGLSGGTYNGSAAATFGVVYGTVAGSAVPGNQTASIVAGSGLTGGVSGDLLGDGLAATLNVVGGNGIAASADSLALGPLTADWSQTGAFDVVLANAGSELRFLESAGATFYGTLDVGDLANNQTYTFSGGDGTVWTSGNDGAGTGLDADLIDGKHASELAATTHNHDATYVNEGQADSVTSTMLVNGTVTAADLADGASLGEIADDDGAGSGLDADLLDGQQAAAFAAASHAHDAAYVNVGEAAGGSLTGTYPNPAIAANAVGAAQIVDGAVGGSEIADGSVDMADTVNWMGAGVGSSTFSAGGKVYIYGPSFTPSADGTCLVTVSASIHSTGSANDGTPPVLDTVRSVNNGPPLVDPVMQIRFAPGDVDSNNPIGASANWVWSVTAGQPTRFGCRVSDPDSTGADWGDDETLVCRVAYICQ